MQFMGPPERKEMAVHEMGDYFYGNALENEILGIPSSFTMDW